MSRYKFSYLTLRGKHYPLIPIRLYYRDSTLRTFALVDSGSTLSVFRAEIADGLGVRVENGEKAALQAANAPLTVYVHADMTPYLIKPKVVFLCRHRLERGSLLQVFLLAT